MCLLFSRRFWNLWPTPDSASKFQDSNPTIRRLRIRLARTTNNGFSASSKQREQREIVRPMGQAQVGASRNRHRMLYLPPPCGHAHGTRPPRLRAAHKIRASQNPCHLCQCLSAFELSCEFQTREASNAHTSSKPSNSLPWRHTRHMCEGCPLTSRKFIPRSTIFTAPCD